MGFVVQVPREPVVVPRRVLSVVAGRVLSVLLVTGDAMSAEEIAGQSGLARRLVINAGWRLQDLGFVTAEYATNDPDEFSYVPLRISADRYCAIGVKILPHELIGVITDLYAKRRYLQHRRTLSNSHPATVVDEVVSLVRHLRQAHGADAAVPDRLIGLGVELGGHVDGRKGKVHYSPNLGWRSPVELGRQLRRKTGLVTVVENDVNAMALYASLFGSGSRSQWFGVVLFGDGIGSGLILDGRLAHGSFGLAGELGHVVVEPDGRSCRCGNVGCLESVASKRSIIAIVREHEGHERVDNFGAVVALADDGDPVATATLARAGDALGRAVSIILNLVNLDRLVVAMPEELERPTPARKAVQRAIRDGVRRHSFSTAERKCQILYQHLPDFYGSAGAATSVVWRLVSRVLYWETVAMASNERVHGDPGGFREPYVSAQSPNVSDGSEWRERDDLEILR